MIENNPITTYCNLLCSVAPDRALDVRDAEKYLSGDIVERVWEEMTKQSKKNSPNLFYFCKDVEDAVSFLFLFPCKNWSLIL